MNSSFFSLRKKLLISFGTLFAVSLFLIELAGFYGIPFTGNQGRYSIQKAEAYRDLESLADSKKELLQLWLNERRADVQLVAQDEAFRQVVERINKTLDAKDAPTVTNEIFRQRLAASSDWQWLNRRLKEIRESHPNSAIDIISVKSGRVIACSRDEHVGENRKGDQGYLDTTSPLHSEIIRTAIDSNGRYSLHISMPMNGMGSQSDETVAVITSNTDLDAIMRPMVNSGVMTGRSGEVFLVNNEGQSLTSLRYPRRNGTTIKPLSDRLRIQPVILAINGGEGVIATKDYRDTPVLAAYRHLRVSADVSWGMVVKMDQSEAFAPLRRTNYYIATLGLLGSLVVMLLTGILSGRLARPIDLLHRAAKKIQDGDLTARADVNSNDEVGILAASFNSMVTQIQGWQEELESQVRSRTEQLESSNRSLLAEMAERKHAVEAHQQSEARFRELLENIQLIAVTLDQSGNVTFCNDYLLNLTGWQLHEVLGCNWFDRFIPPDLNASVKELFSQGAGNGNITGHYENAIITRDGKCRYVVWNNTVLHGPDRSVAGVASIGVDVTDHRGVEEQLRQSQKMEAIGRLAGGVAHDFNNMLGVIIGYAEISMNNLPQDDKLRHRLNEIIKAGQRSSEITRQLLAFSRKEVIAPKLVNLNALIIDTEKTLGRLIGEDIRLCFKPSTALWPVKADPSQIDQILINLAVNARDAMPDGGTLTIETANIQLDETYCHHNIDAKPGDYVRISVNDTGCGMDSETRKHIFEPFFTTKDVGKGTGLGLATIYGIVTQNNGFINVYSEPGLGSTFMVYLPRSEETGHPETVAATSAPAGSGTVLVVEDDPNVLAMTTDMLEQIGYTIITASNPAQAIKLCQDPVLKIDMVISDVIMPTMNGREMVEQIKSMRPDIKVLFMSGYTSDIIASKGVLESGMNFLMKPFNMTSLNDKIKDVLGAGY